MTAVKAVGGRRGQLSGVVVPPDRSQAACVGADPEVWFPDSGRGAVADWEVPRAVCDLCPLRQQCLDYAMAWESDGPASGRHGMWGGLSPAERAALAAGEAPPPRRLRHGTYAAFEAHIRDGSRPCVSCRLAASDRYRRQYAAGAGRPA